MTISGTAEYVRFSLQGNVPVHISRCNTWTTGFLAISLYHNGRLMRNLERRWRITCRCRSRDQNCNFRKFKMADGRHFDNSFISHISAANHQISIKFGWQMWISIPRMVIWQKIDRNFANSRRRLVAILKFFFVYISVPFWPICGKFIQQM